MNIILLVLLLKIMETIIERQEIRQLNSIEYGTFYWLLLKLLCGGEIQKLYNIISIIKDKRIILK